MNKKVLFNSGFTLIELLVVSTIIIVLAAMGMVSFASASKSARDGRRKTDIETVRQAVVLSRQQTGTYPSAATPFATITENLAVAGYLSRPTPIDPGNNQYTYTQPGGAGTFCICADLENTTRGNSTNTSCAYNSSSQYYCVSN